MPGDERNRRGRSSGRSGPKPDKRGASGSRDRSDRARDADARRSGGRGGTDDRGRRTERDGQRPERGPRPPIKGKRRVFDEDSAPNERERARSDQEGSGEREQWIDEGPVRRAAGEAVRRGGAGKGSGKPRGRTNGRSAGEKPGASSRQRARRAAKRAESVMEIDRGRVEQRLGKNRADRTINRIGEATAAYAEDRYEDARRILKPIVELLPDEPSVRELYGLSLYRLGKWRQAGAELEAVHRSDRLHRAAPGARRLLPGAGPTRQGRRALGGDRRGVPGRPARGRGPHRDGRLARRPGQGRRGHRHPRGRRARPSNLKEHHLRMRYVLADLYDRAGDHQAARR